MYVSVNKKGEIKEVGVSTNPDLKSLFIADETNPFNGWSKAKICCYKVNIRDGIVMMMTPYIDSRLIEHFDALGTASETNASDISDNREGLTETFESTLTNTDDIASLREGLEEVYEMLLESEV